MDCKVLDIYFIRVSNNYSNFCSMEATITRVTETIEIIVIRTLLYLEVLDAIPAKGSVSLTDIASATSAQPSLLERLLRTVVGTEGLSKTENGDYSHTPESLTYTLGGRAFLEMFHDKVVIPFSIFPEYLEAKRHNLGLVEPGNALRISFYSYTAYKSCTGGKKSFTHNPFT